MTCGDSWARAGRRETIALASICLTSRPLQQTFLDLLLEVGVERIMFSVDHPYGSMMEARLFLDQIPVSARRSGAHRSRQR